VLFGFVPFLLVNATDLTHLFVWQSGLSKDVHFLLGSSAGGAESRWVHQWQIPTSSALPVFVLRTCFSIAEVSAGGLDGMGLASAFESAEDPESLQWPMAFKDA